MKNYMVIDFAIEPAEPGRDLLLASLDDLGFDSFEETAAGLKAYITQDRWSDDLVKQSFLYDSPDFHLSYSTDLLENKNWNEEWETNYTPILIGDQVYVYAPFHPEKKVKYPIQITPKMSFGTGHHQTTRLMARLMLEMDLKRKKVLDMGTGTGVLAILAEMMGANNIDAIDNFDWAVTNTEENAETNHCKFITAELGDAELLPGRSYAVILANINRNVLLEDISTYRRCLQANGELLLSGFYEEDFHLIRDEAEAAGLQYHKHITEDNWVAARFTAE